MRSLLLMLPLVAGLSACSEIQIDSGQAPRAVSIDGHAEVRSVPDRARFTAAVITEGDDADTTLSENNGHSERLLNALREAGVATESLRTTGVRLQPVWSSRPRNADADWRPRIIGYRARNQLEVSTADLAGVGSLLAIAVREGAREVDGVHFSLHDDGPVRSEAIRKATERAMSEARTAAEAAGTRIGQVLELRVDGASTRPPPMLRAAMMDAHVESASVPVEPGELTVTANVSLRIALD